MINSIKESIIYVLSLDLFLGFTSVWLYSFQTNFSIILSFAVGISGIIVSILSIIHLYLKLKSIRLDHILKELEIKNKQNESKSKTPKNE